MTIRHNCDIYPDSPDGAGVGAGTGDLLFAGELGRTVHGGLWLYDGTAAASRIGVGGVVRRQGCRLPRLAWVSGQSNESEGRSWPRPRFSL